MNSKNFLNATILLCWTISEARNDLIFNVVSPNIQAYNNTMNKEMALTSLRVKERSCQPFSLRIQNWLQFILYKVFFLVSFFILNFLVNSNVS